MSTEYIDVKHRVNSKKNIKVYYKFKDLCMLNNLDKNDVLSALMEKFNLEFGGAKAKKVSYYIDGIQKEPPLISDSEAYKLFDKFCKDGDKDIVKELDKAMRHYLKSCKHYVNFI